jgi:hypothetical protein
MPERPIPLAYFISFRTYGTWLHGDPRGSVERGKTERFSPLVPDNPRLERHEAKEMLHEEVVLDSEQRRCVDATVRAVCATVDGRCMS